MVVKKGGGKPGNKPGNKPAGGPKKAQKKTTTHNPFEFRKNKERSAVLGKVQPSVAPTGHARAHAFELRKNTLQVEMEKQDKHNVFIDKREKEVVNTKGMSSHELLKLKFDKLLGKAPKERGGVKRKNLYNLVDEEVTLPVASALGSKTNIAVDDAVEFPEGEGEEQEETLHDGKKKTNKERFAEIMAKSKYHKYLRQKEKEERENVTEDLNLQFKDLQQDLYATKRTRQDTEDEKDKKDPNDDYMKLLRTFEQEGRAPASDRSRTTEEVMREENEKLLKLEEARLKRMLGIEQNTEEDVPRASGDDLTDDFTFGKLLDEDGEEYDEGDDDDDGDDLDDAEANALADLIDEERRARAERRRNGVPEPQAEEEEEEGEEDDEDEEEGEESGEEETEKADEEEQGEIPFRIEVPENNRAFAKLLDSRSANDRMVIIDRIMVGSHYTLNRAQNVPKMKIFMKQLWYRFVEVSKFKGVNDGTGAKNVFAELNHIAKYLWELSQQFPDIMYNSVKETLAAVYKKFTENLETAGADPLSMQLISIFQIIGNIFPTTDFQNSVVTPTFTFIGHAISLSPITALSHLTRALFLSSLSLSWLSESHRFATEPLTLLGALLERFATPDPETQRYYIFPSLLTFDSASLQFNSSPSKLSPKPLDLASLSFAATNALTDQQRLDVLHFVVQLTSRYFEAYSFNKTNTTFQDCIPQLFGVIRSSLAKLESQQLGKIIQDDIKPLLSKMDDTIKAIEKARKPLVLQDTGPRIIESLRPHYNPEYNGKKTKLSELPESVRNNKMKKRVRKEQLKAEKELTRDTQFIANQWAQKRKRQDAITKEHTNKVMSLLEKEAHEKKMDKIRKNPIKFTRL